MAIKKTRIALLQELASAEGGIDVIDAMIEWLAIRESDALIRVKELSPALRKLVRHYIADLKRERPKEERAGRR